MTNPQDFGAKITWFDNWADHLTKNGRTIDPAGSCTVVASAGVVTGTTPSTTGVRFRLDTIGIPVPPPRVPNTAPALDVVVAVTATLDNGDIDVRHHTIRVTKT